MRRKLTIFFLRLPYQIIIFTCKYMLHDVVQLKLKLATFIAVLMFFFKDKDLHFILEMQHNIQKLHEQVRGAQRNLSLGHTRGANQENTIMVNLFIYLYSALAPKFQKFKRVIILSLAQEGYTVSKTSLIIHTFTF